MEKIKVKAYGGILTVTKERYIFIQSVVFILLIALFIFKEYLPKNIQTLLPIVFVLEIIETAYMSRKFIVKNNREINEKS